MDKIASLPNSDPDQLDLPSMDKLAQVGEMAHPPRILMLYGSLRERSFSRFLTEEAARILAHFGAEVKIFDPMELPMAGSVPEDHPKVAELRELCLWSEGQVWCSPERHGAITAVMKNQIDWIPLEMGAIRPSQGRTLAVMQGHYVVEAALADLQSHQVGQASPARRRLHVAVQACQQLHLGRRQVVGLGGGAAVGHAVPRLERFGLTAGVPTHGVAPHQQLNRLGLAGGAGRSLLGGQRV